MIDELHVRIGDRDLLEIFVHRSPPFLVATVDFERHLSSTMIFPVDLFFLENARLVLLGIDLNFEIVGRRPRAGAGDNLYRFARCQLRIHARSRYADALLPAAHAQPMKVGSVEKLREYSRNLLANNAGAIIDYGDSEPVRLAWRLRGAAVRSDLELDHDFRQNPRFLTRVERIVDRFLYASEQCFSWIVEAEQMTVLGKELGNGNLPLPSSHLDRR